MEESNPGNLNEPTNVKDAAKEKGERENKRRSSGRSRKPMNKSSDWTPDDSAVAIEEGKKRFHDFSLPDKLMHAIHDLGFEYCTPIQADTIKPALAGKDIIGKAQTLICLIFSWKISNVRANHVHSSLHQHVNLLCR